MEFYVRVTFRPGAEAAISQSGESYLRETQISLRRVETDRDNETLQRAAASLQADLARLTDMTREIERAQRLAERGLLATDQSTLQAGMARLRAELERIEAQLRSMRLTSDDRARVELQYRAAQAQLRNAEQQFRAASAQQAQDNPEARLRAALREVERRLAEAQIADWIEVEHRHMSTRALEHACSGGADAFRTARDDRSFSVEVEKIHDDRRV